MTRLQMDAGAANAVLGGALRKGTLEINLFFIGRIWKVDYKRFH